MGGGGVFWNVFLPKLLWRVEVQTLCRQVKFFYTKLCTGASVTPENTSPLLHTTLSPVVARFTPPHPTVCSDLLYRKLVTFAHSVPQHPLAPFSHLAVDLK